MNDLLPRMGYWRMVAGAEKPHWSPELFALFGRDPSEGPPRAEALGALFECQRTYEDARRRARAGEEQGAVDLWITKPDGERRLLRISVGLERGADGAVSATYGVVVDVTDLNRAAAEARAKEQLLATFIDHAPAALAMFDMNMRYVRVSPRWIADYGLDGQDVIGRSHYEVFPEISDDWKEIHKRCLAGAIERCERDPFDRADGRRQWLSWEVRPWRDASGAIGGLLMLTRDVTELVASMEELERTEKRLQLALEASDMLVWQRDRRSGDIVFKGALEKLFGPDGLPGRLDWDSLWALIHPEDRGEMMRQFHEAVANKTSLRFEHRVCPPGSNAFWAMSVIEPVFDANGEHAGAVGLLIDISARRADMEALAEARVAAEASSIAKSEFVATMSHEIRTPMNGVMGAAQALVRTKLDTHQRGLVDLMLSAGGSLRTLVDDALDLGRIDLGDISLRDANIDLGEVLHGAIELFRSSALEKGLRYDVDLSRLDGIGVRGDAVRLRQIASNIVGNAVKYTDRGAITIAGDFNIDAGGRAHVVLMVRDTGLGVQSGDQQRIFERFEQSARAGHDKGGAGLGLAIARGLARAMDGDVRLIESSSEGSSFAFEARLARQAISTRANVEAPLALSTKNGRPLRILVVEDNKLNQDVVAMLLQPFGAELTFVEDGAGAVTVAISSPFDLVLMDIQLPGMNGFEATRAIRALERSLDMRRTPIICLTAQAANKDRERAKAAGADAYVAKPIVLDELITSIETVLGAAQTQAA